jgi:hypothetical protein
MADTGSKTDFEWAWEFHKNCDQLLHQRLTAFTATQAMTLAAFTVLTIARFQTGVSPDRLVYVDLGRYLIAIFGLAMAACGWLVTYPMYRRLQYLNTHYLAKENGVYKAYIETAVEGMKVPILKFDFPLRTYRRIIPIWLPLSEIVLWVGLMMLTSIANIAASGSAKDPPPPPQAEIAPQQPAHSVGRLPPA